MDAMDTRPTVLEIEDAPATSDVPAIPDEVSMLCSALETGQHAAAERRTRRRRTYRTAARLRLFSDASGAEPTLVYTRDVDLRGVGFITRRRLPLGYGGLIELPSPDGRLIRIHGTLIRCRLAAPGWYEGAVSFNREQPDFVE